MLEKKKKKRRKIPKKSSFKFSDKSYSKRGIISTIIGIISLIVLTIIFIASSNSYGNGELILGLIGDLIFIASLIGLGIALYSFKESDIYYRYSILGAGINSLIVVSLFALFVVGLSI